MVQVHTAGGWGWDSDSSAHTPSSFQSHFYCGQAAHNCLLKHHFITKDTQKAKIDNTKSEIMAKVKFTNQGHTLAMKLNSITTVLS